MTDDARGGLGWRVSSGAGTLVLGVCLLLIIVLALALGRQYERERQLLLENVRAAGWIAHNTRLEHERVRDVLEQAQVSTVPRRVIYLRLSLLASRLREITTSGQAAYIRKVFADTDRIERFSAAIEEELVAIRAGEPVDVAGLQSLVSDMSSVVSQLTLRTLAYNETAYAREEYVSLLSPLRIALATVGIIALALVLFAIGLKADRRRTQTALSLQRTKRAAERDTAEIARLVPPAFIIGEDGRFRFTTPSAAAFLDSLSPADRETITDQFRMASALLMEGGREGPIAESFVPEMAAPALPRAVEIQFSQVVWHGEPAVLVLLVEETWVRDELRQYVSRIARSHVASTLRDLAHELKQPIWLIDLTTRNLVRKSRPEIAAEIEGPLSKVRNAARRMNDIVDAFRSGSDDKGGDEIFALRPALDSAISLSSGMLREVAVALDYRPGGSGNARIAGSRILLEQAIFNLIKNSCEAFARSPTAEGERREIGLSVTLDDETAWVSLSDGAGGMDENLHDPFAYGSSTKHAREGLRGVGLAFTRKVVEDMGGTIECHNQPGVGVGFVVSLPLARADTADGASTRPAEAHQATLSGLRGHM